MVDRLWARRDPHMLPQLTPSRLHCRSLTARHLRLPSGTRMMEPTGGTTMVTAVQRPGVEATTRNPGIPLDLDWIRDVRINRSAVERRAATLVTRRTVKKEWQAAW